MTYKIILELNIILLLCLFIYIIYSNRLNCLQNTIINYFPYYKTTTKPKLLSVLKNNHSLKCIINSNQ